MKVLFHINELERFDVLYGNVNNIIKEAKKNKEAIEVIVLANGVAVKKLVTNEIKEKLAENFNDVKIYACENSLKTFGINEKDLIDGIYKTGSGVYFLAVKQKDGYLYIKP